MHTLVHSCTLWYTLQSGGYVRAYLPPPLPTSPFPLPFPAPLSPSLPFLHSGSYSCSCI